LPKIFITIPWFLPAFRAGGPVQSIANLVREYREDVTYHIFCSDVDLNGAALEKIRPNEWVAFNDHTQVWYAAPEKISDTMVRQVSEVKPDVLFIIGLFSWHFNMVPLMYCKAPKKIISTRGMLHPGALSQKRWKKRIYLRLFKLLEYHYKVQFHATDEEEHQYINNFFDGIPEIFTAGNFPNNIGGLPLPRKEPGQLNLISIALISPMKNILLVLQALEKADAVIKYDIYGPVKDLEYWDSCLAQIKKLPANVSVVMHKELEPAKVSAALASAHVFILPSKSENFGHAIYEALSAGRPVITSYNTPWNHLRLSMAGSNVSLEDTPGLYEAITVFAAMDEATFTQWHHGAIAYAVNAIDMDKIRSGYKAMFTPL
jgi:glycosyltransferase involved in cell wall biosynthesis